MLKDRLRELREASSFSQAHTAKALDIGTTAYSNYERGVREPDSSTLAKMADLFDCTTDFILGKDPFKNRKDYKSSIGQVEGIEKVFKMLERPNRELYTTAVTNLALTMLDYQNSKEGGKESIKLICDIINECCGILFYDGQTRFSNKPIDGFSAAFFSLLLIKEASNTKNKIDQLLKWAIANQIDCIDEQPTKELLRSAYLDINAEEGDSNAE